MSLCNNATHHKAILLLQSVFLLMFRRTQKCSHLTTYLTFFNNMLDAIFWIQISNSWPFHTRSQQMIHLPCNIHTYLQSRRLCFVGVVWLEIYTQSKNLGIKGKFLGFIINHIDNILPSTHPNEQRYRVPLVSLPFIQVSGTLSLNLYNLDMYVSAICTVYTVSFRLQ